MLPVHFGVVLFMVLTKMGVFMLFCWWSMVDLPDQHCPFVEMRHAHAPPFLFALVHDVACPSSHELIAGCLVCEVAHAVPQSQSRSARGQHNHGWQNACNFDACFPAQKNAVVELGVAQ